MQSVLALVWSGTDYNVGRRGGRPPRLISDFYKGLPQLIATSGLMGAGGEHIGQSHANQQQKQMQGMQPVAPSLPEHGIPDATTQSGSGSGQPPQSTANKGQSPSTSPPPPAADLSEVGKVVGNIQRLKTKAKDGPLSLDEQRELDHSEKVLAHTRVKNLEKEQQVIRSLPNPRELDPHKTQVLADARAVLERPAPGAPPAKPSAPPQSVEKSQTIIHNIMNRPPEQRGHPTTQADLAQAQQVVADHVQKLESQSGSLNEAQKKQLTDAQTALARLAPPEGGSDATVPGAPRAQSGTNAEPMVEHSRGRTNDAGYKNDRRATAAIVASNQKLAEDAPARVKAPSTLVRMNFHDSHSETMRQAMLLADHAHDAVDIKPVKMTATTTVGKDGRPTSGVYRPAVHPYDAEIGVSRDAAYPIMTGLHEFGHHVRHHLDENDFNSVVEAAKQTPEAQLIKEMNYDPGYWLHENELFARAYAQWVIESVNHPEARVAKEELQNILGSAHSLEQFSGPAWQKVKTRINIAMQPKEKP